MSLERGELGVVYVRFLGKPLDLLLAVSDLADRDDPIMDVATRYDLVQFDPIDLQDCIGDGETLFDDHPEREANLSMCEGGAQDVPRLRFVTRLNAVFTVLLLGERRGICRKVEL